MRGVISRRAVNLPCRIFKSSWHRKRRKRTKDAPDLRPRTDWCVFLSVPLIQTRASLISGLLLKRGPTSAAKFFQCALSVLARCQKSKPQKPCQLFSLLLKNAPHCPLHQVGIFFSCALCFCVCAVGCVRASASNPKRAFVH